MTLCKTKKKNLLEWIWQQTCEIKQQMHLAKHMFEKIHLQKKNNNNKIKKLNIYIYIYIMQNESLGQTQCAL